ncbi:Zinc-finger associated domain (zf-AD) [Popillia japonica]|uniref:Zinc-finger associated domain (Zf-AD) n=1 Tax=Popillia japonica TaxID=7064 RepID=A0AAW1KGV6_POPJA
MDISNLNECTSLKVHKHDDLSSYICKNCVQQLTSAWRFRIMAIESDTKLHHSYSRDFVLWQLNQIPNYTILTVVN